MNNARLILGDCREVLPTLETASVDFIFCDPPYPEIARTYGRWTEAEWFALMRTVVPECMRILKPSGSAVFVLQPNSERVGRMRTWLWEFMAWVGKEWGIVQDAWWWNPVTAPTIHCQQDWGLLRPSVKACVWIGGEDCYRDQSAVLWEQSEANLAQTREQRFLERRPGGQSMRRGRCSAVADIRGGVTPFNLLPLSNTQGREGHGGSTPLKLADWWLRYCCPPGGLCCDPFSGTATVGIAAAKQGKGYVGIEVMPEYHETAQRRLSAAQAEVAQQDALFAGT